MEVTSTELQNNFGSYLKLAQFEDVYITRNGKRVGVLKHWPDSSQVQEERAKYDAESDVSYEDFAKLVANSDQRYELIDGKVYQLASPSYSHQIIISDILNQMYLWSQDKKCKPVVAPFDVTLEVDGQVNVVQPDITLVCDQENLDEKGKYHGVPSLVVEVLSPSTQNIDMVKKLNLYMSSGINEYWIINVDRLETYLYTFKEKQIENYRVVKEGQAITSEFLDDLQVRLTS